MVQSRYSLFVSCLERRDLSRTLSRTPSRAVSGAVLVCEPRDGHADTDTGGHTAPAALGRALQTSACLVTAQTDIQTADE